MVEEFHGEGDVVYQQLYGWNTINANVWLPSLSELVGTTGVQNTTNGCYCSAMQGLNTSGNRWIDVKGGDSFTYFKQYNASGGGEKIWGACNREIAWLRSSVYATTEHVWRTTNAQQFDWGLPADSQAVHPAVEKNASCSTMRWNMLQ